MRTLLAVMALCGVASAQDDGDLAKRHFIEGSKAFHLGEFTRAVEEYRMAYNNKPDPSYLYNIAQAYRLAGDLPQALFFYRSYLHSLPDATNRDEVEERIKSIDEQVRAEKEVATKPPNSAEPAPPPPKVDAPPQQQPKVDAPPQPKAEAVPVVVSEAPPAKTPLYKKWWLWTAAGGVVVAGVVIAVAIVASAPHDAARPPGALTVSF
jgi:tetratricopeptide (TPR) repeat protein